MKVQELLSTISDKVATEATVRRVFGEPITIGERTVIPVARIGWGWGGGLGSKDEEGEGGGGGGGVGASASGVVEVTPEGVEYVEFGREKKILGAALVALAAGFILGRLGRR